MKASCWMGVGNVEVHEVPDPRILNQQDAILKVSSTSICGSDLHLYNGLIPTMLPGDILGHEFMGEVVEIGREVRNLSVGDRVVVAFPISCGRCAQCRRGLYSSCGNSNPNAWLAEKQWGGTRPAESSATPTRSAALPAARPSMFGSPSPTSARSGSR